MPKPTTYQRPVPINRNARRTGAPVGKPNKQAPPPAPEARGLDLQLDLRLPRSKPFKLQ